MLKYVNICKCCSLAYLPQIISLDKQITEDRYILPAALYEHARIFMTLERLVVAQICLILNYVYNYSNISRTP